MFLNETYITHNGLNIVFNFWQNRDTIGGSTGGGMYVYQNLPI